MLFRPPVGLLAPVLSLSLSQNDAALSWPASAVGWSLQMVPELSPSPAWSLAVHAVTKSGGAFHLTLPRTAERQFFRLIQP